MFLARITRSVIGTRTRAVAVWPGLSWLSVLLVACVQEPETAPHASGLSGVLPPVGPGALGRLDAGVDEPSPLSGMTSVPANELLGTRAFLIDPYEAVTVAGQARSIEGEVPRVDITFSGAVDACGRAGKRICDELEWRAACSGPDNFALGFQRSYAMPRPASEICDLERRTDETPDRVPSPAGSHPDCKTRRLRVWDMIGNVAEWVAAGDSGYAAGFDLDAPELSSCEAGSQLAPITIAPTDRHPDVGFRCCADRP